MYCCAVINTDMYRFQQSAEITQFTTIDKQIVNIVNIVSENFLIDLY